MQITIDEFFKIIKKLNPDIYFGQIAFSIIVISVNEKKDSNIFLTSIIEEFMPKIDEFLNKENKEDKENYKIKFKDLLGNVSFKINNMKGDIKKK